MSETATRVDSASRLVHAPPERIFAAFVDPEHYASWLPPEGMSATVEVFEPRPGGAYGVTLRMASPDPSRPGKSSADADIVRGRFVELVPGERIVQTAVFDSDDPAFAGEMKLTWHLTAVPGGTLVTVRCENVPNGIRPDDHEAGLSSTLKNLAAKVE